MIESFVNYENDQSLDNFILILLNGFSALPNLGLLAYGVGGIGWAALKAAAKAAVKSGGKDAAAAPIANKILKLIKDHDSLKYGFNKIIDSLQKNGNLSEKGAKSIKSAIEKGSIDSWASGKGVEKALSSISKKEFKGATKETLKEELPYRIGKISARGKGGLAQLLARATDTEDISSLKYPEFLPTKVLSKEAKDKMKSAKEKGEEKLKASKTQANPTPTDDVSSLRPPISPTKPKPKPKPKPKSTPDPYWVDF